MRSLKIAATASPLVLMVLLAVWTLALNALGLCELEFLRHTEADRTLIAWRMLETGEYLLPHLLDSPILTKPPLFYWLLATCFSVFADVTPCLARLPSVLLSVVFVLSNYLFLRRAAWSAADAAAASFVLSTSLLFFSLSVLAEIDLTFGLLCSLSFYAAFFAMRDADVVSTLLMYCFAALAFLTKGPPIVFFLVAAWGLFFLYAVKEKLLSGAVLVPRLKAHALGVLLFVSIILSWLLPLAREVGADTLLAQFEVEVLERVLSEDSRGRGVLFYAGAVIAGLLPWSVVPVLTIPLLLWPEQRKEFRSRLSTFFGTGLLRYHLLVVVSALLMLTIAEGKSSRYLFPVMALCVNLLYGYMRALTPSAETLLCRLGACLFPVCSVIVLSLPLTVSISGVSFFELWSAAIALSLFLAILAYACVSRKGAVMFLAFGFCMLTIRYGQAAVYAPHRNHILGVQSAVQEIHQSLPEAENLYVLEMYERWLSFYLKKQGRDSIRLRPAILEELSRSKKRLFLLLNADEQWRAEQIRFFDSTAKSLGSVEAPRGNFHLYEIKSTTPQHLGLSDRFPTSPTKPHPLEREFYRILNKHYPH